MTNDKDEAFNQILLEAFQAKVWAECCEHFENMTPDEQHDLLSNFARILEEHGASSKEMWDFFHVITMKFSRTYYLVETLGNDDSSKWDSAMKELQ